MGDTTSTKSPTSVGLFAGIGGIELGLERAGFETTLLCDSDPSAQRVLRARFPDAEIHGDVTTLDSVSGARVVSAGFPCQDLSQVGRTAGIDGAQSGLVGHVFRLLDEAVDLPEWLLLENVPFMLALDRGQAMSYLVDELSRRGYMWAYRVIDARAFGRPQRRLRVILLASKESDPRSVLFPPQEGIGEEREFSPGAWCGFYWTEGLRGLGWAVDAVPTLKGGSGLGIPSPPAVWNSATDEIGTPDIRDAERLQGFRAGWTKPALEGLVGARNPRWKLVGNAVSVSVSEWVGRRLLADARQWPACDGSVPLPAGAPWPKAAWGDPAGGRFELDASTWPVSRAYTPLGDYLNYDLNALSYRAAAGFQKRLTDGTLRTFAPGFRRAVDAYVERTAPLAAAA